MRCGDIEIHTLWGRGIKDGPKVLHGVFERPLIAPSSPDCTVRGRLQEYKNSSFSRNERSTSQERLTAYCFLGEAAKSGGENGAARPLMVLFDGEEYI